MQYTEYIDKACKTRDRQETDKLLQHLLVLRTMELEAMKILSALAKKAKK